MQSLIVLASLVSELAGGQNDPPLVLNVTKNTLVIYRNFILFISNPQNIYTCCTPYQMGAEVLKNS